MKKIGKILPLLLAMPLIAGCGGKVKAPKFADAGNKIDAAKFQESIEKAFASCAYGKEEKVGSFETKASSSSSNSFTTTRGKKTVDKTVYASESSGTMKYDSKNHLLAVSSKYKGSQLEQDERNKTTSSSSSKKDQVFEEAQKDGAKYFVEVDKLAKVYSQKQLLDDKHPLADVVDLFVKEEVLRYSSNMDNILYYEYAHATEEEKKNYSFYQSGNIYTIEYKHEVKDKEFKDGSDEVEYVETVSELTKVQIDFTDGKMSFKYFAESTSKQVYKKANITFAAGDIYESHYAASSEANVTTKDVKLKAVDVSKFTPFGFAK